MATLKLAYGNSTTLTNAIASLATSSTWTAGYESDVIDNSTNLYVDYELSGKVTVGTTPTTATEIRLYIIASMDGSTWYDVFDGTTSAETVTSEGVRDSFAKLAAVLRCDSTTTDRSYPFFIGSVASLFGGICPTKFAIFTAHNTGVNLNSSGANQVFTYRGAYYTSA